MAVEARPFEVQHVGRLARALAKLVVRSSTQSHQPLALVELGLLVAGRKRKLPGLARRTGCGCVHEAAAGAAGVAVHAVGLRRGPRASAGAVRAEPGRAFTPCCKRRRGV